MWRVEPYTAARAAEWDDLVARSRNGSLLHLRGYMDYHSDRFKDASLLAFNDKGKLLALLPANAEGDTVCSHCGLTFGGWLTSTRHFDAADMLEVWHAMCTHYSERGFNKLVYKPVPHVYHRQPADDDIYALFRHGGAAMTACNVSTALRLDCDPDLNMSTRQNLRRALRDGITIHESDRLDLFWPMLEQVLAERHSTTPTHTLAEMELLRSRFPDRIRLLMAYGSDGMPQAGTVVYIDPTLIHTQYMATTADGRRSKALIPLVCAIRNQPWAAGRQWLDFGSSCEQGGLVLNQGLLELKSGLGGRTVACPTYTVSL